MGDVAQTSLIDIHVHLCQPELRSRLPELLEDAASCGVKRWAVNAAKPEDWPVLARLARNEQRGRPRRVLGSLPTLPGIFGLTAANAALEMLLGPSWPRKP